MDERLSDTLNTERTEQFATEREFDVGRLTSERSVLRARVGRDEEILAGDHLGRTAITFGGTL